MTIRDFMGLALSVLAAHCGGQTAPSPAEPSLNPPASSSAWSDEFDGPEGSPPDPALWTNDIGNNGGWGNGELETYTNRPQNAHVDGRGHLVIRVESTAGGYTSARLKTQGRRAVHYGRLEARIKLPTGQGVWPAFWMLGGTFNGSNWPQAGEIDVMENIGSEPFLVRGTVHGPQYSGGSGISARYELPGPARFSDDFHTFAVHWRPGELAFVVDGATFHVVTSASLPSGAPWVFDQPFFVLLNVAVGGNFAGPPGIDTAFPQDMVVDYVRYTP